MNAFADIRVTAPTAETLAESYRGILEALRDDDPALRAGGLAAFDAVRRQTDGWAEYARTKFYQDTTDAAAKAERDRADVLSPVIQAYETDAKRAALADPAWLSEVVGHHVVALWQSDVTKFDPVIADDLIEEARLTARYTELIASARFDMDDASVNLSGLPPYLESTARATRERAARAQWAFFEANGETFDTLFADLVRLRDGMARKLGFETFIPLGYRRMRRTDYGPAEVATFRDAVLTHVVPVLAAHFERVRAEFGYDVLRYWDTALIDPAGNPKPAGDEATLLDGADAMFTRLNPDLAHFFRDMRAGGLLDLATRPSKSYGGFCSSLGDDSTPFIFANFNGTFGDVEVLTHEMGHAFQCHRSAALPGFDALWPSADGAEIHSMSLEMLCLPEIAHLVGPDAQRTTRYQVAHTLLTLAQCAHGDHFQHDIYADPSMTPAARRARWRDLEARYLPWRRSDDIPHLAAGGWWHRQLHFFELPFYFIDYALAGTCAMQFWERSKTDATRAWSDYVALCGRGGSAPFLGLVASANLASPFDPATIAAVAREAAPSLG